MSKPRNLSEGEEALAVHCQCYHVTVEREFQFALPRKWAFDFAIPEKKLAIEVEGGTKFGKSRHSQGDGFERDCRKYNAASMMGWRLLRFSSRMVITGEAIDTILQALQ